MYMYFNTQSRYTLLYNCSWSCSLCKLHSEHDHDPTNYDKRVKHVVKLYPFCAHRTARATAMQLTATLGCGSVNADRGRTRVR